MTLSRVLAEYRRNDAGVVARQAQRKCPRGTGRSQADGSVPTETIVANLKIHVEVCPNQLAHVSLIRLDNPLVHGLGRVIVEPAHHQLHILGPVAVLAVEHHRQALAGVRPQRLADRMTHNLYAIDVCLKNASKK